LVKKSAEVKKMLMVYPFLVKAATGQELSIRTESNAVHRLFVPETKFVAMSNYFKNTCMYRFNEF
jgi:hypothetical protein